MLPEKILHPGDKIDLRLSHLVEQEQNGKDVEVKIYKSSVCDFVNETDIEITMPLDGTKMVVFQKGLHCDAIFYTNSCLYKCKCLVKDRYKKQNMFFLLISVIDGIQKFQRRQFFRIDCSLDLKYYNITEDIAELDTTEQLIFESQKDNFVYEFSKGIINDISGGGIRFTTTKQLIPGEYILSFINLCNNAVDESFVLVTKIIASNIIDKVNGKFSNRAQFIYKDLKDREKIVRFVFEEERRIRRKEMGE